MIQLIILFIISFKSPFKTTFKSQFKTMPSLTDQLPDVNIQSGKQKPAVETKLAGGK